MIAARVAALFLGLLAGAMLLIAVVLVPFWAALPPAEFRRWFAANAPRIGSLMLPLGAVAAVAAVAAVFLEWQAPGRGWLVVAAAGAVGVAAVTLAVNEPANQRFVAPDGLSDRDTAALLERWIRWHRVRVALGVAAFYASILALAACRGP
jgi:uncharacterized membrane protein